VLWSINGLVSMTFVAPVQLDASQRFQYRLATAPAAGNGLLADVLAFVEEL
jgi:hypothetical protein